MSLQLRLTLSYTLILLVCILGMGITSILLFAQDLAMDFREDLVRLAEAHAENALKQNPPTLQIFSTSPIPEEIEDPQLFLLDSETRVLQSLANAGAPAIPAQALEAARQGSSVDFLVESPDNIPLLRAAFSLQPIPHERRAVLYPFDTAPGGKQYSLMVLAVASDVGSIRVLHRLRQSALQWLLIGFALALVIGYLVARQVSRPLREIGQTAYLVQQGELSERIPNPNPTGEIGRLKRDLNTMLGRLENLMEVQRRFTADAAHDLRTPLAVIKSDLEITLRRERTAEEYRAALERMRAEVSRMIQLAEDLLTLSRLEAGQTSPFKNFVLHKALETILPLHTTAARNKGLTLSTQIPQNLLVFGDEGLVVRAVSNLLANAVTHSEKGNLAVRAEQHSGQVWLSVLDSGPGIPQGERELILERFVKGERSKGAGLGLSIVSNVARLHQGGVHILDRPGGGAVFTITLPEGKPELPSS